jgi:hypothetical protein
LKLRFLGQDSQALELAFGIDNQGRFFANRVGTPTVMHIDESLIQSIPIRPYEWRHSRLWSVDRLSLMAIERKTNHDAPLMLRYDFNSEIWTASSGGNDLTSSLNPERANYLLTCLEGLSVTRWLPLEDPSAIKALLNPSLTLRIIEKSANGQGDFTGLISREVSLAPGSHSKNPAYYYGRLNAEAHPFLMDRETYTKLASDLLDKD